MASAGLRAVMVTLRAAVLLRWERQRGCAKPKEQTASPTVLQNPAGTAHASLLNGSELRIFLLGLDARCRRLRQEIFELPLKSKQIPVLFHL